MNNPTSPSSLGPLSSEESFAEDIPSENFPTQDRSLRRRGRLGYVIGLSGGLGFLYWLHHDVAIGTVIIAAYAGLYWAFRKNRDLNRRQNYPVIRYRGHSTRQRGFFS